MQFFTMLVFNFVLRGVQEHRDLQVEQLKRYPLDMLVYS